jgi:hypothetical protein
MSMTLFDPFGGLVARYGDDPLFYTWSADAQKLYAWLRAHAYRGEHDAPPEARAWHAKGFLATYATAEQLMEKAAPVSKNTMTKLIGELRHLKVCQPRNVGRGYVFLLGEWLLRHSDETGSPLAFEAFYLDAMLRARDLAKILGNVGATPPNTTPFPAHV